MNTEPWVTAGHVAQHLGVAKDTVCCWRERKDLSFSLAAGAIGHTPESIPKTVLTSEYPVLMPEGFLNLEIPVPSLDEQDKLITGFARADEMVREAGRLRQSAWITFEPVPFTPAEPIAA